MSFPEAPRTVDAVVMQSEDAERWDSFVETAPSFALQQSWRWGTVKESLGWTSHRVAVTDGSEIVAVAQMLIKRFPLGAGSLAYVPRGPVGDWEDPTVAACLFDALHEIARDARAVMLKIEPGVLDNAEVRTLFSDLGFRRSPYTNQPCATILVDLEPDEEAILAAMNQSTRRHVRLSQRKGVTVRQGSVDDLDTFYELMVASAERAGFTLRSREYYETEFRTFSAEDQAVMLLAEHDGDMLGAHIAYAFGPYAASFHLPSANVKSNLSPNHLLIWEQILWAKGRGCRTLDLWGIPDEIEEFIVRGEELPTDRTDGLWGVFRFKRGFSKDVVAYAGSYDYVYAPARYSVINPLTSGRTLETLSSKLDGRGRRTKST